MTGMGSTWAPSRGERTARDGRPPDLLPQQDEEPRHGINSISRRTALHEQMRSTTYAGYPQGAFRPGITRREMVQTSKTTDRGRRATGLSLPIAGLNRAGNPGGSGSLSVARCSEPSLPPGSRRGSLPKGRHTLQPAAVICASRSTAHSSSCACFRAPAEGRRARRAVLEGGNRCEHQARQMTMPVQSPRSRR